MPDYTTIAQRIAEAKRRGCKVQKTVSGHVYDPDNMVLYDPDHDADCKSHGVSIVEPEPLWPLAGKTSHQVLDELPVGATWKRGCWNTGTTRTVVEPGKHQFAGMVFGKADYFDWPADDPVSGLVILSLPTVPPAEEKQIGRQDNGDEVQWYNAEAKAKVPQFLAPCPKCGGKCRLHNNDPSRVVCDAEGCDYGFGWWQEDKVRLADHTDRTDRTGEIMALFRELNERLGKLLEGKS